VHVAIIAFFKGVHWLQIQCKSVESEETILKTVQTNNINPFIQPVSSGPVRGRSRTSLEKRSQKRSKYAEPYRRKSVSKSRENKRWCIQF